MINIEPNNLVGYLSIIVGPMYSGKTSRLLEYYKQYKFCNISVAVINYVDDIRYSSTMLSTHDKNMIPCTMTNLLFDAFPLNVDAIGKYKVFLINEGQFFDDIVEWVSAVVSPPFNKRVHICGLDGDFQRKPFGNWLDLVAYSDKIEKLTSICSCCKNKPGLFSFRVTNEKQQKVIGSDNYIPLCRDCYEKKI